MTQRDPRHDVLFEQVRIGPKVLPNRFFAVPHSAGMGVEKPGSQAAFRGMKAAGGWGAVCLEFAPVSFDSDSSPSLSAHLWSAEDARRLGVACASIHAHGSLAGVELTHLGGSARRHYTRWPAIAPSAIAVSDPTVIPKAMELSDIERIQRDWTDAAIRARDVGFDIVYVYATDLISQFLSPLLNQRSDAYGGSLPNRLRFYLETLERVRAAVGDDCAVATRIGIDGLREKGVPDEAALSILEAVDPLVDLWDINREPADPAIELAPSRAYVQGSQRELGLWARQVTTKPMVSVGRLTDPDLMVDLLKAGAMHLVGGARPSIADPFLPEKIRDGRYNDIRECIGCNVCARTAEFGAPHLNCTQNATAGEEHRRGWHPEIYPVAEEPERSVLVVGGGPAGMECAIVLGKRGFENVHLVEAGPELGGHMRWVPRLPHMAAWNRVVEWRTSQLRALPNVETILNKHLSAAEVLDYGAEIVICATGSAWAAQAPGVALEGAVDRMLLPEQIMVEGRRPSGSQVLVYDLDSYFVGAGLAELLASEGYKVRLATPHAEVAAGAFATAEAAILRRSLYAQGVSMHPGLSLIGFEDGAAVLEPELGEPQRLPAESLVLVTHRASSDGLYLTLTGNGGLESDGINSVLRVGDCVSPRLLADAIFDGHRLGRELDGPHPAVPLPTRGEHDWRYVEEA